MYYLWCWRAGRQLVVALENSPEFKVVGFLDDNISYKDKFYLVKTIYSQKFRKIN
jgi:hypothetical protein